MSILQGKMFLTELPHTYELEAYFIFFGNSVRV